MRKFSIFNFQFSNKLILLLFTLYIIHYTFYITPVFAQADSLGESRINPASPLYFLKAVRETLEWRLADTTDKKALRQMEFATRRLKEVNSLVKSSRQDLIEPTLYKYLSHLQELSGILNLKDSSWAARVTNDLNLHLDVLQAVYNQVSDSRAKMSIRVTINRLTEYDQQIIDKLVVSKSSLMQQVLISKLKGCHFLAQEASSAGLNQIESTLLKERAEKCFK